MSRLALLALLASCAIDPDAPDEVPPAGDLFATGSPAEQALAEDLAWAHLESKPDKLAAIGGLRVEEVRIDDLAMAHVRMRQEYEGVEVFGGQTFVHLHPDGTVRGVTDHALRDIAPVNSVLYTPDEALDVAAVEAGGWEHVTDVRENTLMVYRQEGIDRFVYVVELMRIDFTADTAMPVLFVDAGSSEVVFRYDNLQTLDGTATTLYNGAISFPISNTGSPYRLVGDGVGTYTFNNAEPAWNGFDESDLTDITSATTVFSGADQGPDAQFGIDQTLDYFFAKHGRVGIDGIGGPTPFPDGVITGGVNYGASYTNAFWNGYAMVFGDGGVVNGDSWGPLTSLDIAAHELSHGVTESSANLFYYSESGAMNESMSDVFAVLVEAHVEGENTTIWDIGEDMVTPCCGHLDGLRSMKDPTADGVSREHYTTRYFGQGDSAGVHLNSGIGNLAFALAVDGGSHPNPAHATLDVNGVGLDRAGAIWYRALTTYMGQLSGFQDARSATALAAIDLYGPNSFELESILDAWSEVGVDGIDTAGGYADTTGGWTYITVDVPANATELRINTWGLTAYDFFGQPTDDVDLYTRFGANPTLGSFDCRSTFYGNTESCIHLNPAAGTWHIGLYAYETYNLVILETRVVEGCDAGAAEIEGNDVDENCDDLDADCGTVVTGSCTPDLVITEIMVDPGMALGDGEWVEVYNRGAETVDLKGAALEIGASSYTIDEHFVLAPGAYGLFSRDEDPEANGGLPLVQDDWEGMSLPDASGTLTLRGSGGAVLDAVAYTADFSTGAAMPQGASISLDPSFVNTADNDTPFYWCDGMSGFGDGDFGTPGAANEPCAYSMAFTFRYDLDDGDDDGLQDDIVNTTTMDFWFSDSARGFTTGNSGEGTYLRDTTAAGQSLDASYANGGVIYTADRASGTDCFTGGQITNLPGTALSGSWTTVCP